MALLSKDLPVQHIHVAILLNYMVFTQNDDGIIRILSKRLYTEYPKVGNDPGNDSKQVCMLVVLSRGIVATCKGTIGTNRMKVCFI